MTYLELKGLTKTFGSSHAVDNVDLSVAKNEFVSLLGPSGCGKSTTLRLIAGLQQPTDGEIVLEGQSMAGVPISRRPTSMVFQRFALFPHLSVLENVAFGLKIHKVEGSKIRRRAEAMLDLVDIASTHWRKLPSKLSGGQQQRVALARSLVLEPKLLLLDEPLSSLDAQLRVNLRRELRTIHERAGATTIFVTHDLDEAFELSDRVAVMRDGRIQQFDTPENLYRNPVNEFVANFVGHKNRFEVTHVESSADVLQASLRDADGRVEYQLQAGQKSPVRAGDIIIAPDHSCVVNPLTSIGDGFGEMAKTSAEGLYLTGIITDKYYRGSLSYLRIKSGATVIEKTLHGHEAESYVTGMTVSVHCFRPNLIRLETGATVESAELLA